MIHRLLSLPERRSCLLLGPRQTGKSTLVREALPPGAWTIDLLQHDSFLRYARDPSSFRKEAEAHIRSGTDTIFVDEVQKLPVLLDEIQGLIEAHKCRFIMTGSSARKLRRRGVNLLAGRASIRTLHPLTCLEQGAEFELERSLRFGDLPPVVTSGPEDAREILQAYSSTYLREEIQAEALVRNLGGFSRFLDVAAAQCGEILNYSAVARDASIATRTVQEYFTILEDTLLGFRLEPWRLGPRARLVAHPRFYFFDPGVVNALMHRLTGPLDSIQRGRLFEQWIILETRRLIDYRQVEARTYYWRTSMGAEVDLVVVRRDRPVLAIEIKSKRRIAGGDLSGLRAFQDSHPGVRGLVVCNAPEETSSGSITILPWRAYLERFESLI